MKAFEVTNIKEFMGGLLTGSLFDDWQFRGAELSLEVEIELGALVNHAYMTDEEGDYLPWPALKDKVCGLIKGRKQPSRIHLSLALSPEKVPEGGFPSIEAYGLNLQYESGTLTVITAVSEKSFSLDKEPGRIWDAYLPDYLAERGIELTEI